MAWMVSAKDSGEFLGRERSEGRRVGSCGGVLVRESAWSHLPEKANNPSW
jgi:hypothetical protein